MSVIQPPPLVKPFLAAFGADSALIDAEIEKYAQKLGKPDWLSPEFDIFETNYYENEMGAGLKKRYVSWPELMPPDYLVDLKLWAMDLESKNAVGDRRMVNLDPGYIFVGGLVLSTAKFSGHRLYLGRGIWGELTMHYHRGDFTPFAWTYPDYMREEIKEHLRAMRKIYMGQLKAANAC